MYKFDTKVQHLKYKVLRTVAKHAWDSDFYESFLDIPKEIIPGKTPTMRCCVYKERAILAERVKLAAGGDRNNPNVIEALDIACDDCPTGGYTVTEACRGCIAHRCEDACPRGAITHDEFHHAHIDKSKCINCGKCAAVCPYSAIYNRKRPCQNACKIGAISMNEDGTVKIDNSKCISCGACVYQCPFGALSDKSFILDAIKMLKNCDRVYAIVAPAIVSQFTYAKPGQVITAIKALGFCDVLEAALGADMVAYNEAAELAERGFLTSSCCPAFVSYIRKSFPELQAMFDSRELDVAGMEETVINNASGYGRIFAHCGGLAAAAAEALKEQGIEFELKPLSCNGIEECKLALMKAARGKLDANFVEGMACVGGCVNGAGCMTHNERNRVKVDAHSQQAHLKSITDSLLYAAEIDRELKEKAGDKA